MTGQGSGLLRIERVSEQAIDVELWSRSRHAARLSSIRATDTSRERPLEVTLAEPCSVIVVVDAPGIALPKDCEIAAHEEPEGTTVLVEAGMRSRVVR